MNANKRVFVTYGDNKFANDLSRIKEEALSLNRFDHIIADTDSTIKKHSVFQNALQDDYFNQTYSSPRGGGYWIWKPFVIFKTLQDMKDGGILLYTDAGCKLINTNYAALKMNDYERKARDSASGILGFRNPCIESTWTKGDAFCHFNLEKNSSAYSSRQFTANRLLIQKNKKSVEIINKWWTTAKQAPFLFDDSPSKYPNFENFQDHRHDQSILSLILKTSSISEEWDWKEANSVIARKGSWG